MSGRARKRTAVREDDDAEESGVAPPEAAADEATGEAEGTSRRRRRRRSNAPKDGNEEGGNGDVDVEATNDDNGDHDVVYGGGGRSGTADVKEESDKSDRPPSSPFKKINAPGKPAEAGVIKSVYVENFMCHRKLTVDLCRNVNFIYGRNGSGKSAVLAAIQICLGAGARRTHRARNLKDLIRKGKEGAHAGGAKVRVTLHNQGNDAFQPDEYGDEITVERCIPGTTSGFNGYKLLSASGREVSRHKRDLDTMLDQLNIQVENPVAVLDQEEAKKFLSGRPQDKYAFFSKATDLERMDRTYASTKDNVEELEEQKEKLVAQIAPAQSRALDLEKQWEEYQEVEKLQENISEYRQMYAWSLTAKCDEDLRHETETLNALRAKCAKEKEKVDKAKTLAESDETNNQELSDQLDKLMAEANKAQEFKENLENELRQAHAPLKKQENMQKSNARERNAATRRLQQAKDRLKDAREQIMQLAGNAESEEARRTARLQAAETEIAESREKVEAQMAELRAALKDYEKLEPHFEQAKADEEAARSQFGAVKSRLRDLESSSAEKSLTVFGNKCADMYAQVENARRAGKFCGPVIGPIGQYLKITPGKEDFAKLAEKSLGGGVLDRFIVTNNADRNLFQSIRKKARCGPRDCGLFQMSENGPRYSVPAPPCDQVETTASVLHVTEDLVFNCLVDNCRIDQIALSRSKDESEQALLTEVNGKEAIRGRNINLVYFLPHADCWQVRDGYRTMTSNDNPQKMRQSIGVDRSAAIEEARGEAAALEKETEECRGKSSDLAKQIKAAKKLWNERDRVVKRNHKRIQELDAEIRDLKAEADNSEDTSIDTSELEEDVTSAEEAVASLKEKEAEIKRTIERLAPALEELRRKHDEITARNERVATEIGEAEDKMSRAIQDKDKRKAKYEKHVEKLARIEDAIGNQLTKVAGEEETKADTLYKAKFMTLKAQREKERRHAAGGDFTVTLGNEVEEDIAIDDAELEAVEPLNTDKDPDFYKAKIERALKQIQREREKRSIVEVDPAALYAKLERARGDVKSKMDVIATIDATVKNLIADVSKRKKRWREFRTHISRATSTTFDELLNRKGSCGELVFDHKSASLNITFQKDSCDELTQTKDVKALSGGERSFTTLSLLLALGENLETPFRVMDEFDVFLDPMARRIALRTMIQIGKDMEHRQFIFITPQDLSNIKPDPMLRIIKMRQPRADQQTID